MSRLELRPLADEHLDAAAEFLAERHRRHRAAEPTLPERFEDAAAAREEIEAAWRRDGASGAAGVLHGPPPGYPPRAPADEAHRGGPHAWVGPSGPPAPHPRRRPQGAAPVFSASLRVEEPAAIRAAIEEEVAAEELGLLVAEADGRLVGAFVVAPAEQAGDRPHEFTGLARPERAAYLAWAVTLPEARGSGVGVALTDAAFAWARRAGYETMVTDWRAREP